VVLAAGASCRPTTSEGDAPEARAAEPEAVTNDAMCRCWGSHLYRFVRAVPQCRVLSSSGLARARRNNAAPERSEQHPALPLSIVGLEQVVEMGSGRVAHAF
jgi:hypothetical protein